MHGSQSEEIKDVSPLQDLIDILEHDTEEFVKKARAQGEVLKEKGKTDAQSLRIRYQNELVKVLENYQEEGLRRINLEVESLLQQGQREKEKLRKLGEEKMDLGVEFLKNLLLRKREM